MVTPETLKVRQELRSRARQLFAELDELIKLAEIPEESLLFPFNGEPTNSVRIANVAVIAALIDETK